MVLITVGCALQLVLLLGWVVLAKGGSPSWEKWVLVGLFVVASMILIYKTSRLLGWRTLLLCCGGLALAGTGIYQLLGFTMFPGLVKDVELLSWEHLTKTLVLLGLGFIAYAVLASVVRCISGLAVRP